MPTKFCRHIRVNGERCASPALSKQIFCYYHVELERRHRRLSRCNPRRDAVQSVLHPMTLQDGNQRDPVLAEPGNPPFQLDVPPLEDRHSIQVALSLLITALAQDRIDPKRAALLFYGLQIASANARDLIPVLPKHKRTAKVRETILDEASGDLVAPDEDPEDDDDDSSDYERPGFATRYLRKLEAEDAEKARQAAEAKSLSEQSLAFPPPL